MVEIIAIEALSILAAALYSEPVIRLKYESHSWSMHGTQ
ncbi:hypothetical protein VCRA2133E348_210046 [Vibrio crassostreae]|nr:hypothetical protein VCRA2119O48_200048 [Vibrio crassostreae]CAK2769168.1 hypothetical protein VCRA2133E348_210046 [Vibrio crassostreae]CAK3222970.1 hypothetical protein VCRA213O314_190053 [Vibrio crassostreae]CAK3838521.1 hypothetical protein VCRA212O16_210049 [Vibrio crassostreae]